jgi:Smg protein
MYHRAQVDSSHDLEFSQSEPISRLNRPDTGTPLNVLLGLPFPARNTAVNENVIDVLIYIYENYMDAEESVPTDQIILEEELVQAGFPQGEIKKAFNWLDELAWRQGSLVYAEVQPNRSMRIYSERESQRIDLEIQGMLLYLEQTGILDPMSRELVIERAMAIETEELTADDVKWIVLLVLLNQPGQENAFALMEELVYNGEPVYLH